MATVTFKPIGKREREWLEANHVRGIPSRLDERRGNVVTIDGLIVLAWGRDGQVIYQDGSGAIPNLVRARRRVSEAIMALDYEDLERIKRKGKPRPSLSDILNGTAA